MPQEAKLQRTVQYLQAKGIPENLRDVFNFFDAERSGYNVIAKTLPHAHSMINRTMRLKAESIRWLELR